MGLSDDDEDDEWIIRVFLIIWFSYWLKYDIKLIIILWINPICVKTSFLMQFDETQ